MLQVLNNLDDFNFEFLQVHCLSRSRCNPSPSPSLSTRLQKRQQD